MEAGRGEATATTPQSHRDHREDSGWLSLADGVGEGDPLTERIIGCAIEVHRHLGPGLLESTYQEALCVELAEQGLSYERQLSVPIVYKGHIVGQYRLDLLVEAAVVVEIKSVERYDPLFQAQVLTYLRSTGEKVGLLINFNTRMLHDGVKRFSL